MNKNNQTLRQALKSIVLAEITRYKKEMGVQPPNWSARLNVYANQPGYFMTFVSIPKLGINPVNTYGTPTGIYAYPILQGTDSDFAREKKYVIVFKPKPGVKLLSMQEYTEEQLTADINTLWNKYAKVFSEEMAMPSISHVLARAKKDAHVVAKKAQSISYLWFVTRWLAISTNKLKYGKKAKEKAVSDDGWNDNWQEENPRKIEAVAPNEWARILRNDLGYQGVVDMGYGLIHESERYQAVFFSASTLDTVELIQKPSEEDKPGTPTYIVPGEETKQLHAMVAAGQDLKEFPVNFKVSVQNFSGKTLKGLTTTDKDGYIYGNTFQGSSLVGWRFKSGTFAANNLRSAKLKNVIFGGQEQGQGMKLYRNKFINTTMDGISLHHVNVNSDTYGGSAISNLGVMGSYFSNANIRGAKINSFTVSETTFGACDIELSTFSNGEFFTCQFRDMSAGSTHDETDGINCSDVKFKNTNFGDCYFRFLSATNVTFEGCTFSGGSLVFNGDVSTVKLSNVAFVNKVSMQQDTYDKLLANNPELEEAKAEKGLVTYSLKAKAKATG